MHALSHKTHIKGIALGWGFCALALLWCGLAQAQWRQASENGLTATPKLQLKNLAGEEVNLSAYKGKVVMINFWASWCEPCREEFEELIYLQEKYGAKGLKVFAVNLAEMKPRIEQFLKGNTIAENAIEILQDRNSTTYKTWKARGIPTTFLIGRNGKVEGMWIGAIDDADSTAVKEKIETLLKQ
jgi:thiol-disulfide isomerase/thioredoxin